MFTDPLKIFHDWTLKVSWDTGKQRFQYLLEYLSVPTKVGGNLSENLDKVHGSER